MPHRILVVDDDPDARQSLQSLLGYVPDCEVDAAANVGEGRSKAAQGYWDIIISDEQMPDGRGSDLLAELSRERPGPHHVLLSGFGDFDALLRGPNAAHIDHFIRKPYDPGDVLGWVQRTLRDRAQGMARAPRAVFRRLGALPGPGSAAAPAEALAAPPPFPRPAALFAAPPPAPVEALPPPPPAPGAELPALAAAKARAPAPSRTPLAEALRRTADEGLEDLALLVQWSAEATSPDEKLKHARMAMRRLEHAVRNLEAVVAESAGRQPPAQ